MSSSKRPCFDREPELVEKGDRGANGNFLFRRAGIIMIILLVFRYLRRINIVALVEDEETHQGEEEHRTKKRIKTES